MNPFFKWLTGKRDASRAVDISCAECVAAWQEVAVRELCLQSCINMVANAIGRCEVRTFAGGREVQDREYYMLNIEPNVNQNSSAFWHKVISQLYRHNEALIISTATRDGRECLVCADSFYQDGDYPAKMNTYKGVVVGQVDYNKTFRENEVIHLKLNERNIRPALEALASSYDKLISAAEAYYVAANGVHIKAHVDAIAQQATGDDLTAWQSAFAESLKKVVVPFLQSGNGVLPEFDGYHYERMELATGGSAQSSQELRALVERFSPPGGGESETSYLLTCPATTKTEDMLRIYRHYAQFKKISSLIVTKLDETGSIGSFLTFAYEVKLPVSFCTNGQGVPDDLMKASTLSLTEYLTGLDMDLKPVNDQLS